MHKEKFSDPKIKIPEIPKGKEVKISEVFPPRLRSNNSY